MATPRKDSTITPSSRNRKSQARTRRKAGIKGVPKRKRRSLANMIGVMIRDCCQRNGGRIPVQRGLFAEHNN